nr:unnamed protein product [Leishmania braziliensis]
MLVIEEQLGRQTVHTAELEARHDITALLVRSYFVVPPSCPHLVGRSVHSEPDVQPDCLAAASSGHSKEDCDKATKQPCSTESPAGSPSTAELSQSHRQPSRQSCAMARQCEDDTRRSSDLQQLSSLWRQLSDLDERLAEVEWTVMQCRGAPPMSDTCQPQKSHINSFRPTMDDLVALLDSLLTSREETRAPQWAAVTAGTALPPPIHSRQQHTLAILAKLRDALRSTQASYKAATGIRAHVSLETLLQLPPETLLLLTCTNDGMRNVRQPQSCHSFSASGGAAAWCDLRSSTSLYTLWAALMDAVDMFPCFTLPAAEALWAAVLWMHTCAPLAPSIHGETPAPAPASQRSHASGGDTAPLDQTGFAHTATGKGGGGSHSRPLRATAQPPPHTGSISTLQHRSERSAVEPRQRRSSSETPQRGAACHKGAAALAVQSRLQEDNERWAYRDFPVRHRYTAPTVYDDLFPLPTAVSAFMEPPLYTAASPSMSAEQNSGPAVTAATKSAAVTNLSFYTGPARRPRPLV